MKHQRNVECEIDTLDALDDNVGEQHDGHIASEN